MQKDRPETTGTGDGPWRRNPPKQPACIHQKAQWTILRTEAKRGRNFAWANSHVWLLSTWNVSNLNWNVWKYKLFSVLQKLGIKNRECKRSQYFFYIDYMLKENILDILNQIKYTVKINLSFFFFVLHFENLATRKTLNHICGSLNFCQSMVF